MTNVSVNWEEVPEGWALCFNSECPRHESCLRWLAAQQAPQELTVARCVTPLAQQGGKCRHFATTEKLRYARGFSKIYDKVAKKDYTPMRKQMTEMLSGKRYYYEYMRGERRLSPEQQLRIQQLFAEKGYADSVQFDHYEENFTFPFI